MGEQNDFKVKINYKVKTKFVSDQMQLSLTFSFQANNKTIYVSSGVGFVSTPSQELQLSTRSKLS